MIREYINIVESNMSEKSIEELATISDAALDQENGSIRSTDTKTTRDRPCSSSSIVTGN